MGRRDPPGVMAGRQADDAGRVRADEPDPRPGVRLEADRDPGLRLPGSSACCAGHRASTARSSRPTGPPGGTARSAARGCARARCRRPGPPSAGRSRRRSSRTGGPRRAGSRGPCARRRARTRCGRAGPGRSGRGDRRRAGAGSPARARPAVAPPGSPGDRCAPGGRPRTRRRPSAASTADTPSPFQATTSGPIGESMVGVAVGQPDLGEHARGERGRGGRQQAGHGRLQVVDRRWSCGHLLALAPLGGLERRSQQGQAAMDLRLDGALGSVEGGRRLRDR